MKAFFVGLLVVMLFLIFSVVGIFLLPFIFIMGFFLKTLILIFLLILVIWIIGKVTLLIVAAAKDEEKTGS